MAENNLAERSGVFQDQDKNTLDENLQDIDCLQVSDLSETDIVAQQESSNTDTKKDTANSDFINDILSHEMIDFQKIKIQETYTQLRQRNIKIKQALFK